MGERYPVFRGSKDVADMRGLKSQKLKEGGGWRLGIIDARWSVFHVLLHQHVTVEAEKPKAS